MKKPYMKVVILDFQMHNVAIENLPYDLDTTDDDKIFEYLSKERGYNLNNCQWMVDPKHIGVKGPERGSYAGSWGSK